LKTRLIFVRHAEALGNKIRRFHGWTDSGITDRGHLQAERVAERLRDTAIDVIYSSSLKRAVQTAEYIARVKGLTLIMSENLKEINGGDWEDHAWTELEQKWPDEYEAWENQPHRLKMPNGESMEEFQGRLLSEVMTIIKRHEGQNICIVTHGTAIRAMICHFRSCTLKEMVNIDWCDNTAITVIEYSDGVFSIVNEGDSSHLGSDLGTIVNQDWWEEHSKKLEARRKQVKEETEE
jgi:broad specificity phosphatase PhoE